MTVAEINVGENIKVLDELAKKDFINPLQKKSILENNEAIKILLERLHHRRPGRKTSEKDKKDGSPQGEGKEKEKKEKKDRSSRKQLPSDRYPNLPVIEETVSMDNLPTCPCCNSQMQDSRMTEKSEHLTVILKKYIIHRSIKHKYTCSKCHGGIVTAPPPPRILPKSSYGDELIIDVALSKYCDLIPIERYVQMAARMGVEGLPANSLIGLTHHLAGFLKIIPKKLKKEVLQDLILLADETPHRMLEDHDDIKSWYLWGFRSKTACCFLIKNTRAGEVAGEFLKDSDCRYLVSDVYSGYSKAVSDVNKERKKKGMYEIIHAYCNAHARRYFKKSEEYFPEENRTFIASYKNIYKLEKQVKAVSDREDKLALRQEMASYFNEMKRECERLSTRCSSQSSLGTAIGYFSRNFEGLTRCLKNPDIPLDNNEMERELRSPVVGRKTWYGTHSKTGAKTAARLFSIVHSCKINGVNPREYFPYVVAMIHRGEDPPTPYEYSQLKKESLPLSQGPPE